MTKIGIVGASGYTRIERFRRLAQRPQAEITALAASGEAGVPVAELCRRAARQQVPALWFG